MIYILLNWASKICRKLSHCFRYPGDNLFLRGHFHRNWFYPLWAIFLLITWLTKCGFIPLSVLTCKGLSIQLGLLQWHVTFCFRDIRCIDEKCDVKKVDLFFFKCFNEHDRKVLCFMSGNAYQTIASMKQEILHNFWNKNINFSITTVNQGHKIDWGRLL